MIVQTTTTQNMKNIFQTHIPVIGVEYQDGDKYVIEVVSLTGPIAKTEIGPECLDRDLLDGSIIGPIPACHEQAVSELEQKIIEKTGKKPIWEEKYLAEIFGDREKAIRAAAERAAEIVAKVATVFTPDPHVMGEDGVIVLGKITFKADLSYEEFDAVVTSIARKLIDGLEEPRPSDYDYDYHVGTVKLNSWGFGPVIIADVLLGEANRVVWEDEPYVRAGEEFPLYLQLVDIAEEENKQ